jgi:hypothetical protein
MTPIAVLCADAATFATMYPRLDEFRAAQGRLDRFGGLPGVSVAHKARFPG